jgi:hypothetical protein
VLEAVTREIEEDVLLEVGKELPPPSLRWTAPGEGSSRSQRPHRHASHRPRRRRELVGGTADRWPQQSRSPEVDVREDPSLDEESHLEVVLDRRPPPGAPVSGPLPSLTASSCGRRGDESARSRLPGLTAAPTAEPEPPPHRPISSTGERGPSARPSTFPPLRAGSRPGSREPRPPSVGRRGMPSPIRECR